MEKSEPEFNPLFTPEIDGEIGRLENQDHPDIVEHAQRRLEAIKGSIKEPSEKKYPLLPLIVTSGSVGYLAGFAGSGNQYFGLWAGWTAASLSVLNRNRHAVRIELNQARYRAQVQRIGAAINKLTGTAPDNVTE